MKPQVENGFTSIANELLEAICRIRMSGEEAQIFYFIMRKTYGYKKTADQISLSQFTLGTGIRKQNVIRAIKNLISKNMIIKKDNKFIINKDYDSWRPLSKKITNVINIDNKTLSILSHTKENIQNKKEILTNVSSDKSLNNLIKKFELLNPMYKKLYVNKTERQALEDIIKISSYEWLDALLDKLPDLVKKPYFPTITKPTELSRKMGALMQALEREKTTIGSKSAAFKEDL